MVSSYKLQQALMTSILCCATVLPYPALAQQHDNNLEPLKLRVEGRIKAGTKRSILETKIWAPIQQDFTSVTYADMRFSGDNNDNFEGNIGVGYRWLSDNKTLFGGNMWFDRRRTERDAFFNQFTFGGEVIKQNYDVRMNAYVPITGAKTHATPVVGNNTTPYLADTGIYYDGLGRLVEKPQYGFDIEAGYQLPFLHDHVDSFRVYAGAYDFRANNTKATTGGRVRAAIDITPNVNVGTRFQYDGSRGSQAFAEMTIRFPFDAKRSFRQHGLRARMDESPARDIDIVTAARQVSDGIAKPVLNAQTGEMQRVIYVDNSNANAGDGSLTNPFQNLKTAEAALQANNVLYIFEGTGDSTHMDQGLVIAHQGVSVIGSGVDFAWQDGKFRAPDANFTGAPFIAATNNPVITNTDAFDIAQAVGLEGHGVLVLSSNAFLTGFTVDGASGNGVAFWATNNDIARAAVDRIESLNSGRRNILVFADSSYTIAHTTISNSLSHSSGFRSIEALHTKGDVYILNNTVINNQGGAHTINVSGLNNFARIANNYVDTGGSTGITNVSRQVNTLEIENNYITQSFPGGSFVGINVGSNGNVNPNVIVRNNTIENVSRNGINVVGQNAGSGSFLIEGNTITGNNTVNGAFYGINIANNGTGNLTVDLGGGNLGSLGGNRVFGNNNNQDIYLDIGNQELSAQGNWWGDAAGLNPAHLTLVGDSTIDSSNWLVIDPGP